MGGAILIGALAGAAILGGGGYLRVKSAESPRKWIIVGMLAVMGAAVGAGLGSQIFLMSQ